jgi:glutathione S-transferase
MHIIGTTSSPYTRKVRIVALERGLAVEFVIDMHWRRAQRFRSGCASPRLTLNTVKIDTT